MGHVSITEADAALFGREPAFRTVTSHNTRSNLFVLLQSITSQM